MNYTFFEKQKTSAKENYNYFLEKLFFKIFIILFKVSIILIVRSILEYTIVDILCIIYIISSIYNTYIIINKYSYILTDIKKTLNYTNSYYIINLNGNFFKKVLNYGK